MCSIKAKMPATPAPPPPAPQMPKDQSTAKSIQPMEERDNFRGLFRNTLSRLRIPLVT